MSKDTAVCFRCKTEKPLDLFKRDKRKPTGRASWCLECNRKWARENVAKHPERERESWRRSQYGLDQATYERMLADHDNCCAICTKPFTFTEKKSDRPHIDHDHETGRIRGLLCHRCNYGLGTFEDRVETLESAIAYLKKADSSTLVVRTIKRRVTGPHGKSGRPKIHSTGT